MLDMKHWCKSGFLLGFILLFTPKLPAKIDGNKIEGKKLEEFCELTVKVNGARDLDSLKKQRENLMRFSAGTQFSNKQTRRDLDRLLDSLDYLLNCDDFERGRYFTSKKDIEAIYFDLVENKFSEELDSRLKLCFAEYKKYHKKLDIFYKLSLMSVLQYIVLYRKDLVSLDDVVAVVEDAENSYGASSFITWILRIELMNKMIYDRKFDEIKKIYKKDEVLNVETICGEYKTLNMLVKIIYVRSLFEMGEIEPGKKLYNEFSARYQPALESDTNLFVNFYVASKNFYLSEGKISNAIASQEMLFGGSLKLYGIHHPYTKSAAIDLRDMLAKNKDWKEMRSLETRFHLTALPMQSGE